MPNFSKKSQDILSWAHPDLRKVMNEAIKYFDFIVLETTRTEEQHNLNVANGNSKTTWEKSKHRPQLDNEGRFTSWAVDIAPYPNPYKNNERFIFMAGFVMCIARRFYKDGKITHQIKWGGNWSMDDDPTTDKFFDGGHFELIGD